MFLIKIILNIIDLEGINNCSNQINKCIDRAPGSAPFVELKIIITRMTSLDCGDILKLARLWPSVTANHPSLASEGFAQLHWSQAGAKLQCDTEVEMQKAEKPISHHYSDTGLLSLALDLDTRAVMHLFNCLASTNPVLCRAMQQQIHESDEPRIWQALLRFMALRHWDGPQKFEWGYNSRALDRIDQSITELFAQDESGEHALLKEKILRDAMADREPQIRAAGAILCGMRGDPQAIPILAEMVQSGSKTWQIRAVKALAAIKDERSGPPLVKALCMNRNNLHHEARRALQVLGPLAAPAWLEVINHHDSHIRWHAARGLGEIGDASGAEILAEGLLDESYLVRWATADVLAQLGKPAVPATLKILSEHKLYEPLRQAAYHALHGIGSRKTRDRLKPLLQALSGLAAAIEAPIVAQRLLMEWEKTDKRE